MAFGIAIDPTSRGGIINLAGITSSTGMPGFPGAVQGSYGGGSADGFLARFAPPEFGLAHFTYLGGSGQDAAAGVAVDAAGNVVLVGITGSADFPLTADATQSRYGGGMTDVFVTGIAGLEATVPAVLALPAASASTETGFAPDAIVSLFGEKLANVTEIPPAPALSVAGVSIDVKDSAGAVRQGLILFVSPEQVNFILPSGTASGAATITLSRQGGAQPAGQAMVQVQAVAPALFAANANGKGAAAAVLLMAKPDGSMPWRYTFGCQAAGRCVTEPMELSGGTPVLQLYGSGIRGRSSLAAVTASVGGTEVEVQFAGAQGGFPGLDQVNLILPQSLAGRGELDVLLSVEGRRANTVTVAFR
jgi:uncharacterized protein (TIGR03437 family)